MEEKYGVELQLITDKFNSNFNKIKNMMKEFSIEAKKNFTTGVNIDTDRTEKELDTLERKIKESVEVSKKQLEELNNAKVDLSELYNKRDSGLFKGVARGELENNIISKQSQISNLNRQLEISNQTVRNYTSAYRELNGDLERTETKMGILGTVVGNLKRTFQDISSYIKAGFGKDTKQQIEDINNELNNTGKAGRSAGNGISSMMSNGVKSLKRFALSLFGIQSIWRILSRASSAYLQQNTELASKMQAVWNGLGTLIGPVIDYLADIFLKLIGYINVMTKALFNFDFVAKTNANTLKNYQKQAQKTSKALAGIDELNNISQQTSEDTGPKGLIEIPELNEGLVKKLQDLSKWLKDNWDWLQKVAEALALAFGAVAIANWVSNIGKLLGFAGVGGAGGSGLLGLASTLGWIAGLGILAVEIVITYKYIKDLIDTTNDQKDAIEQNDKLDDSITDIVKDQSKETKGYKKGSAELNKYIRSLQEEIESNAKVIEDNKKWYDGLDTAGKIIASVTGVLAKKEQASKKASERIEELTAVYGEYYSAGQLTNKQIAYYNELLKYQDKKVRETVSSVFSLAEKYDGLSGSIYNTSVQNQNNNDIVKQQVGAYSGLGSAISNLSRADIPEYINALNNEKNALGALSGSIINSRNDLSNYGWSIDDVKRRLQELTNSSWYANLDIEIKTTINTEALRRAVERVKQSSSGATGSVMGFMSTSFQQELEKLLRSIRGYKIGTDLVKSDGLAYIHAGEQIVPAKAVSGGWTGASNEDTNNLLRQLIEVVYEKDFNATISSDDIGKASVNYIRNQNRLRGGSVI